MTRAAVAAVKGASVDVPVASAAQRLATSGQRLRVTMPAVRRAVRRPRQRGHA